MNGIVTEDEARTALVELHRAVTLHHKASSVEIVAQYITGAEATISRLVAVIDHLPLIEDPLSGFAEAWETCVAHGDFDRGRKR